MRLRSRVIKASVAASLAVAAFFARRPRFDAVTGALMRAMARLAIRSKGIRPARDDADLGAQWQRAFPSAKQVPVTRIEHGTVYAEIHTPCPLRGTGDVHACWRMMEFDRAVAAHAGGQFVVLRSQAEPGRTHCEVALRRAGAPLTDLVPAHEQGASPARSPASPPPPASR
jgi:hypothetical protein